MRSGHRSRSAGQANGRRCAALAAPAAWRQHRLALCVRPKGRDRAASSGNDRCDYSGVGLQHAGERISDATRARIALAVVAGVRAVRLAAVVAGTAALNPAMGSQTASTHGVDLLAPPIW
ncbi:hypothetical protein G6F40_013324 [Rhizopus arrhizus]|nr:hypothetical protein G6F40_013324 [Rhizopus arrhizus]